MSTAGSTGASAASRVSACEHERAVPGGSVFFRAATSACDRCSIAIERKRAGDFPDALNSHVKRRHDRDQEFSGARSSSSSPSCSPRPGARRSGPHGGSDFSRSSARHGSTWRGCRVYPPPAFFWWWYVYDAYAPRIFVEGALIAVSAASSPSPSPSACRSGAPAKQRMPRPMARRAGPTPTRSRRPACSDRMA